MKRYRRKSWIDPRIEVGPSSIEGKGMFATEPIKRGEVIIIWGGRIFTKKDIKAGKAKKHTIAEIDEDLYLASLPDDPDSPDDFMNHSCDASVWMKDEVTLMARRDIKAREELTADYAMWMADEDWVMHQECHCGSPLCRKRVTGKDWRSKELQERYKGHFSPFINKRIARLKKK